MNYVDEIIETDFEVHLTIQPYCIDEDGNCDCPGCERDIANFCRNHNWKATHISLSKGNHPSQIMFTKRFHISKDEMFKKVNEAVDIIKEVYLMKVLRIKVEVPPWDVAVYDLAGKYFESHIKVLCRDGDLERITAFSEAQGGHVSRNAWKVREDGLQERFLTLRGYGTGEEFDLQHLNVMLAMEEQKFDIIEEPEVEYVIYDDNFDLDKGWDH